MSELNAALNDTQLQVLELLGKGIAPAIVAATLDISPSYISQCTANPVFSTELQTMLLTSQLAASQRDDELDSLEDILIEKVKTTIAFIVKPSEALKALQMVNGMKRRGLGSVDRGAAVQQTTVIVNLPSHLQPREVQAITSENNEIVEVDGRAMITKSSTSVLEQLDKHKQARSEARVLAGLKKSPVS